MKPDLCYSACSWASCNGVVCGPHAMELAVIFSYFKKTTIYTKLFTKNLGFMMMTHKYRGCIAVLSINKSVKPNEEQEVLTSSFDQGFTVNTSKQVFKNIW
jgi:hypothetical protein